MKKNCRRCDHLIEEYMSDMAGGEHGDCDEFCSGCRNEANEWEMGRIPEHMHPGPLTPLTVKVIK